MSANICPVCHTQHDTTACPTYGQSGRGWEGTFDFEQSIRAYERAKVLAELREGWEKKVRHAIIKSAYHTPHIRCPCDACEKIRIKYILTTLLGEQKGKKHGKG